MLQVKIIVKQLETRHSTPFCTFPAGFVTPMHFGSNNDQLILYVSLRVPVPSIWEFGWNDNCRNNLYNYNDKFP